MKASLELEIRNEKCEMVVRRIKIWKRRGVSIMAMPEDGISVTSHPRLLFPNPWLLIPAFKLQGLRKIALYMPVVLMLFLHRKSLFPYRHPERRRE